MSDPTALDAVLYSGGSIGCQEDAMPTATMTPLLRHLHKLAGADERLSDAELLNRFCRDQDAHAFKLLVQRHGPMVLGISQRALGASPDSEDAFQATCRESLNDRQGRHDRAAVATAAVAGAWRDARVPEANPQIAVADAPGSP